MEKLYSPESGSGFPVILLHGFPFNHKLWNNFSKHLDQHYRTITPDLPGFGESVSPEGDFKINDVARVILDKLNDLGIKKAVLVGHSLGGYIALSMIDQQPDLFAGLILLHSTALADTEEKKENRDKLIDFVKRNGVSAFTGKFVTPLFIDPENPEISKVREMALTATAETVTGYLKAMKARPDTTNVLKQFHKQILFITGEKDPGIPVESVVKQASLAPHIKYEVLQRVAHMGMLEDTEKTAHLVKNFVKKVTDSTEK